MYSITSAIGNNGKPGAPTYWTGSHDFTVHTFQLLYAVVVFGLVSIAAWIFILRKSRQARSRLFYF